MAGLMTTVTNAATGKNYFVSTVRSSGRTGLYETAVFRQIFGPIANFWRPRATFFGINATELHTRATALVRDIDPGHWNGFAEHLPAPQLDQARIDSR